MSCMRNDKTFICLEKYISRALCFYIPRTLQRDMLVLFYHQAAVEKKGGFLPLWKCFLISHVTYIFSRSARFSCIYASLP